MNEEWLKEAEQLLNEYASDLSRAVTSAVTFDRIGRRSHQNTADESRAVLWAHLARAAVPKMTNHLYAGDCPDENQPDAFDPNCPACVAVPAHLVQQPTRDAKPRDWRKLNRAAQVLREDGYDGLAECVDDARYALAAATREAQPMPAGVKPSQAPSSGVRVECRECSECGHTGINDLHQTVAACNACGWSGPEPAKDHCPACDSDGTMTAACPKCCGRYSLVAEATVGVASARRYLCIECGSTTSTEAHNRPDGTPCDFLPVRLREIDAAGVPASGEPQENGRG